MAVAVSTRVLGLLVQDVARLTGDLRNSGTATAGSTTSLTDATRERTPVANVNALAGQYLYSTEGTGAGDIHEITAYGTIGVMGWAVAGTAPTTTTTWIRLSRDPQAIVDIINGVTRRAAWKQAQPYQSLSIVTNNLLQYYGAGHEFTSGASSAPDGWTLAGAGSSVAREATVVGHGPYSIALTAGAGAVGTLTRTLPFSLGRALDGASLTLHGLLAENVASDGVVRVAITNNAGTVTNAAPERTGTLAGNRWQELKDISTASIAVSDPAQTIAVQIRAVESAVIYANDIILFGPQPIHDYDLPPVLIGLEPVIMMESGAYTGQFTIPLLYGQNWTIAPQDGLGATRTSILRLLQDLPNGRHLLIRGVRAPDTVAATANVEPNSEWLALAAAVQILRGDPPSADRDGRLADLRAELRDMEKTPEGDVQLGRHIIPTEVR